MGQNARAPRHSGPSYCDMRRRSPWKVLLATHCRPRAAHGEPNSLLAVDESLGWPRQRLRRSGINGTLAPEITWATFGPKVCPAAALPGHRTTRAHDWSSARSAPWPAGRYSSSIQNADSADNRWLTGQSQHVCSISPIESSPAPRAQNVTVNSASSEMFSPPSRSPAPHQTENLAAFWHERPPRDAGFREHTTRTVQHARDEAHVMLHACAIALLLLL